MKGVKGFLARVSMVDQFSAVKHTPARDRGGSAHKGLNGRVVVVSDASTTVGSGIVVELLRAGATVVAPLKDEAAVERLLADCSDTAAEGLFPVVADLADEAAAAAFFQDVASKHGSVDHAVSCFGSFWQGGILTEQSVEEYRRMLDAIPTKHFIFAKAALPALKRSRSSSFLFISEGSGKRMLSPQTSLYSVAASAVYGIVLAAKEEYADSPVRVNELRLYSFLKRSGDVGNKNYQDLLGQKAYSNRKVGRLAVDTLLASKHGERLVVTPAMLEGATLTV